LVISTPQRTFHNTCATATVWVAPDGGACFLEVGAAQPLIEIEVTGATQAVSGGRYLGSVGTTVTLTNPATVGDYVYVTNTAFTGSGVTLNVNTPGSSFLNDDGTSGPPNFGVGEQERWLFLYEGSGWVTTQVSPAPNELLYQGTIPAGNFDFTAFPAPTTGNAYIDSAPASVPAGTTFVAEGSGSFTLFDGGPFITYTYEPGDIITVTEEAVNWPNAKLSVNAGTGGVQWAITSESLFAQHTGRIVNGTPHTFTETFTAPADGWYMVDHFAHDVVGTGWLRVGLTATTFEVLDTANPTTDRITPTEKRKTFAVELEGGVEYFAHSGAGGGSVMVDPGLMIRPVGVDFPEAPAQTDLTQNLANWVEVNGGTVTPRQLVVDGFTATRIEDDHIGLASIYRLDQVPGGAGDRTVCISGLRDAASTDGFLLRYGKSGEVGQVEIDLVTGAHTSSNVGGATDPVVADSAVTDKTWSKVITFAGDATYDQFLMNTLGFAGAAAIGHVDLLSLEIDCHTAVSGGTSSINAFLGSINVDPILAGAAPNEAQHFHSSGALSFTTANATGFSTIIDGIVTTGVASPLAIPQGAQGIYTTGLLGEPAVYYTTGATADCVYTQCIDVDASAAAVVETLPLSTGSGDTIEYDILDLTNGATFGRDAGGDTVNGGTGTGNWLTADDTATSDVHKGQKVLCTDVENSPGVDFWLCEAQNGDPFDDVSMNLQQLTSLATPSADLDAANKLYVDMQDEATVMPIDGVTFDQAFQAGPPGSIRRYFVDDNSAPLTLTPFGGATIFGSTNAFRLDNYAEGALIACTNGDGLDWVCHQEGAGTEDALDWIQVVRAVSPTSVPSVADNGGNRVAFDTVFAQKSGGSVRVRPTRYLTMLGLALQRRHKSMTLRMESRLARFPCITK